jgi:hypothetical protein
MGRFLEYDRGRSEILSGTPSFKSFTHGCVKDFGENNRDKDNQHGVELAFSALIARQPIDPTHL